MQVTETASHGLKREFKVVLAAGDLAKRLDDQLAEMKGKVRINGFRPGKVPTAHLRRLYGKSIMSDVIEQAVGEANQKILQDHGLRAAMQPKIALPESREEIERVLEAKGDLSFTINMEALPKFEAGGFDKLELERLVAPLQDSEVESALQRLASRNRTYTPKEGAAAAGDKVTLSFAGKLNGEAFEGGSSDSMDVVIGSDQFIPGFEEQLVGIKADEERVLNVTFPEAYTVPKLAGQAVIFDVKAFTIASPEALEMNDEFAKGFGFEGFAQLQTSVRESLQRDYDAMSRDKLKRTLLDALDKQYSFELPEGLVEAEFTNIWGQAEREQTSSGRSFADDNTTEEASKAEYHKIAERRVRLGLLLADVGEKAKVEISEEDLRNALFRRARSFPGQEREVIDYYMKNNEAMAEIRAPIFEDKVVDHIIALAKVTDHEVTRDELFKPLEE